MSIIKRLFCTVSLVLVAFSVSAQQAWIVTSSELKVSPDYTAKSIVQLREEQPVMITSRKGGWYEVITPLKQKGWVRIVAVRLNADQPADYSGALSSWMNLGGNDSSAVATGVRGLSDEDDVAVAVAGDLGQASISFQRLKNLGVSPEAAKGFAREAGLNPKTINYVEAE